MKKLASLITVTLCMLVQIQNPDGVCNITNCREFEEICAISPQSGTLAPGINSNFRTFKTTNTHREGYACPDGTLIKWDKDFQKQWDYLISIQLTREQRKEQLRPFFPVQ